MKKIVIFLFAIISLLTQLNAQINSGEYPPSFYMSELLPDSYPFIELEKPSVAKLLKEDGIDNNKWDGWRFGTLIPTSINIENSGQWYSKANQNEMLWFLTIKAEDAISINLNFKDFFLSKNAKLFIYNSDYSDVLGALSHINNKKDNQFSIRPILGDEITLELHVPKNEQLLNRISIHQVVYGYKNIFEKTQKMFGGSGNCNININCKEGDVWQDVKRAVLLITRSNNTRICTGTLINNVRQDSTPYVLSAAHCGIQSNSIFIFGYESANCSPNANGAITNSISGASTIALTVNNGSDFHLLLLTSKPPPSYNAFYAGWSAVNQAAPKSASIHHPSGDVKKISINEDPLATTGFFDASGNRYWMVRNWEKGTTESGSSGASLFDFNLRIIGQLHGGDAACGNIFNDYFGKFSYSWNSDTANFRKLKPWLDPDSTQVLTLNGFDPIAANFQNDLQLLYIGGVDNFICGDSVRSFAMVRNRGAANANGVRIEFQLDNQALQSVVSNDTISRQELLKIDLPTLALNSGIHKIDARAFFNSSVSDQDTSNNFQSISFESNTSIVNLNLTIKTDNFGEETMWQILSADGTKMAEGGPYVTQTGGQINTESICVFDSCFTFKLIDTRNDGFNVPQFGNGFALITSTLGDTLLFENSFTTGEKNVNFCVPSRLTSIQKFNASKRTIKAFPNPVKRGENLYLENIETLLNKEIRIFDRSGRLVFVTQSNFVNIPTSIESGLYIIKISDQSDNESIFFQKLLVY